MAAVARLEAIRSPGDGASYPSERLAGCRDALVLFAAMFLGRQDAFWIADAGLEATCVDVRRQPLIEMERIYPAGWLFVEADAYEFADQTRETWDVVSVDCPSGHFDRCADLLPTWCRLARRLVVLGAGEGQVLPAVHGWELVERRKRSYFAGGVYWAVLERA